MTDDLMGKKIETAKMRLHEMGLREFSEEEIICYGGILEEMITTSIHRPEDQKADLDHELMAIQTGVEPVTLKEWEKVPVGRGVLVGSFGGTNWKVSYTKKTGHEVVSTELSKKAVTIAEREHSFDGFVGMMAREIEAAAKEGVRRGLFDLNSVKEIGIAFGFPQINTTKSIGVDAQLTSATPAKYWKITDFHDGFSLGEALIKKLKTNSGISLGKVFFLNDTNSVANHAVAMTGAASSTQEKMGFVFGTGDNASTGPVNLEIGKARLLGADKLTETLMKEDLLPIADRVIIEYWMGGDFIKNRVAMAMELLFREGIMPSGHQIFASLVRDPKAATISELAGEDVKEKMAGEWGISWAEGDYEILAEASRLALSQAGVCIGLVIGSVARAAGYTNEAVILPIAGSVFRKGWNIQTKAAEAVKLILPENQFTYREASGRAGIGVLAMVRTN